MSRSRWLALILVVTSGVAGYAVGNAIRRPTEQEPRTTTKASPRPARAATREMRETEDPWEQLTALLSPDSQESDIWEIVSRLPADKIPAAIRDLRAAQFHATTGSEEARRLAEIASALYFHWAESDPHAALADVSTLPGEPDQQAQARRTALVKSVLAAWMRVDPNAAYVAVKDHEDFGYVGRDMLVTTWTPENVFQNADLYPDKHRDLLGWYCVAAAADDAKRNAMLVALKEQPKMKDRDWAYFMLFRDWAYRDFPAAMAEAELHDHRGLVEHVLEDGLNQQPAATLQWAVSHDIPPGGPKWEKAYQQWLMFNADDAQSWLESQSPGWTSTGQIDVVAGLLAVELDSKISIQGKVDNHAAGEKLISLVEDWQSKDPQAAEKWLETASDSARKLIKGKGATHHE
jgi:hypothetical protein